MFLEDHDEHLSSGKVLPSSAAGSVSEMQGGKAASGMVVAGPTFGPRVLVDSESLGA